MPAFGHHGRPITTSDADAKAIATPKAISDAEAFAVETAKLMCGCAENADSVNEPGMRTASWLVSGVSIMSDWIGSNQNWFRYSQPDLSLEEYWQSAIKKADDAVVSAGLASIEVAKSYGLTQALNLREAAYERAAATPLQEWAAEIELPAQGPMLAVLEDLTGSGKTEAALILAHRFMSQGHASGVYWALPTQATANALYKRLAKSYKTLFGDGAVPSLALAHSSTDLQEDYQRSIFREGLTEGAGSPELAYGGHDEETASALCAEWLASD